MWHRLCAVCKFPLKKETGTEAICPRCGWIWK